MRWPTSVSYTHLDVYKRQVIIYGKPAKVSYNERFGESWAKAEGIDELLTATAEYQLTENWSTRLTYGWNNERYDYAEARPNALNASTGALSRRSDGSEHNNQTCLLYTSRCV